MSSAQRLTDGDFCFSECVLDGLSSNIRTYILLSFRKQNVGSI